MPSIGTFVLYQANQDEPQFPAIVVQEWEDNKSGLYVFHPEVGMSYVRAADDTQLSSINGVREATIDYTIQTLIARLQKLERRLTALEPENSKPALPPPPPAIEIPADAPVAESLDVESTRPAKRIKEWPRS